jgi:sulfoxide reductase heme-binding subunit YedZ
MSAQYRAISWNRQKKLYDLVVVSGVAIYLGLFIGIGDALFPYVTAETLLIRGLGTAALLLLHFILCIGPLCRLDRRFLPLLYNRRHLGVTMFILGLGHGLLSILQFHSRGDVRPLVSLWTTNRDWTSLSQFPFQQLGFLALLILFLMAATSHDFWLRNLTPQIWKRLHMLVYLAYGLLVAHVALGALQSEASPFLEGVLGLGVALVLTLHILAAIRERRVDRQRFSAVQDGFVEVCAADKIQESCATVFSASGERIAVFRHSGKISALSNVCRHQNGPLGEGRIIDGCVTCPWHGYQYLPENGCAPAPFTEKVSTFRTRIVDGRVWVDPRPNPPGTAVQPSEVSGVEVHA